jgi:hypothetical protein
MGVAAPAIPSGAAGIPGIQVPAISAPAISAPASLPAIWGGGLFGQPSTVGSTGASASVSPAGAPGTFDVPTRSNSAMNPLWSLLGGSASKGTPSGGSGISSLLGNIKGIKWGGLTRSGPTYGTDENGNDVQTSDGKITGVNGVAGAALFSGGSMLAEHGLLGPDRGTWKGAGEGAAGGAAIGFQQGGPLGAVIGGVAGFLIGVGEKIAGVKSPQREAHDDIKSIYGVDIPQSSGTIKQVVQIAQSQFGGQLAVAVRSPSVRQLVMLYSEATGQKMPLSATTPYAGNLVEQGGKLYQQASYQDGQAHAYASNIPTLGGIAAGTYPTPGGPNTAGGSGATYLSLNISGNDAANFMTGQFVTPQFVTDQAMAAQYSSYGRTQQSANMQLPGLTVA